MEHRTWLYSKEQIVDYAYGKEFSLDCRGVKIHFNCSEDDEHIFYVHRDDGEYLCTIDDRDTVPTIRRMIEDSIRPVEFTANVRKIGNSHFVLLPKYILDQNGICEDDRLEVTIQKM